MAHAAMPPEEVFVKVCGAAGSEEVIELPADADGAMDYATLCSQFPGAVGLQYHNEQTKTTRALRVVDGRKIVPPAAGGWGARTYVVVVAGKCRGRGEMGWDGKGWGGVELGAAGRRPCPAVLSCCGAGVNRGVLARSLVHVHAWLHPDVATDTAKAQQKRKAPSPDAEPSGQKPRLASESTAPVPQPGPTLPTTAQYELPGKSEPCTRLFLGNLPFSATVEQLKTMFPSALDITLPRHSDSGNIKGFGNATFATVEIAHKVICEKDGFELDGRNVRLDFAPLNASRRRGSASGWGIGGAGGQQMRDNFGKPLSEACNRLHVANLPFTVTEEIMKGLFPVGVNFLRCLWVCTVANALATVSYRAARAPPPAPGRHGDRHPAMA